MDAGFSKNVSGFQAACKQCADDLLGADTTERITEPPFEDAASVSFFLSWSVDLYLLRLVYFIAG